MRLRIRHAPSIGWRKAPRWVIYRSIDRFVASIAETPLGGVKDSGFGCEPGTEGLRCYTLVMNVSQLTA